MLVRKIPLLTFMFSLFLLALQSLILCMKIYSHALLVRLCWLLTNITVTNIYVVKNLLNILWSIANAIPMELIVFQESMRCIVL